MPFPWKRVKSAKISRLVNDHLHNSQKRRDGSSLLVETGFPTSLVDLFIKNREKLKKSSKKRRHSPPMTPVNDPVIAGSPASFSSPLTSPNPIISLPIAGSPDPSINCSLDFQPSTPNSSLLPLISRDSGESLVAGSSDRDTSAGAVDAKRVLFVFVKMFLVAFLALTMKRLTVGITMSAFFLLFLEFLGKHVPGLPRPSTDSKGALKWMIHRVYLLLICKGLDEKNVGLPKPELHQEHHLKPDSYSPKNFELRCLTQEIQIAEEDSLLTHIEEVQSVNEITAESCIEGEFRSQEIESEELLKEKEDPKCEVEELRKTKSRRAKIKLKMKKLFHKKLSSRKEHEPQRLEIAKEVVLCDEQEADQSQGDAESESSSKLSSISSARNKNKEEDEMSALCVLDGLAKVNEETAMKNQEKNKEIKTGSTWRYLVLCLIVLVGLLGGRAFSLLLTLLWFLLLKLGENLPKKHETA